jgi:predicted RNase H-like HicB family nuclease
MSHEFSVVIERDEEGYYVASVPALPGCHTQARSLDELMDRTREAIALCLEVKTGSSAFPCSYPNE